MRTLAANGVPPFLKVMVLPLTLRLEPSVISVPSMVPAVWR